MAQLQIPAVSPFQPHGDTNTIAQRWTKWKKSFNYFLAASGVTEEARKKALLLHLVGSETQDIFDTLTPASDSFQDALKALSDHFEPKKNVTFERSVFHRATQNQNETIEQYVTRLRQLSLHCEYGEETDNNIRDQVITSCRSSKLRNKLLTETELTLEKTTRIAKTMESADHFTKTIEEKTNSIGGDSEKAYKLNRSRQRQHNYTPSRPSPTQCTRCGAKGHLAKDCRRSRNSTCNKCGKKGHFSSMCFSRSDSNNRTPTTPTSRHYRSNQQRSNNQQQNPTQRQNQHIQKQQVNQTMIDENSDEDIYAFQVGKHNATYQIEINNTKTNVIIDSGSTINIIDKTAYENISPKPQLLSTKTRIFPYQSQQPLSIKGVFHADITANNITVQDKIYVVNGNYGSLLGKTTAEKLDVLRIGPPPQVRTLKINQPEIPQSTYEIIQQYSEVFQGVGLLKNFKLKLHIDPSVTPVQQPIRRIPFHTKEKVSSELKRLLELDIIEKVDEPTTWLSPVVPVRKSNGGTRLCLDMRQVNQAIIRERHVIPKIEDILTELHGAKYFTKIDMREGYHQILLDESSRHLTTFATHEGLFRYKRLIYGISTGFECFQKQVEMAITGCKAKNISDDVLIWGSSLEDLNQNFAQVLERLKQRGLKLNLAKCIFAVQKVTFAGHIISSEGISPDPAKISAINNLKEPTNLSEIKSFLGMINYCNRFIPDFSTVTAPIRQLTKKNAEFKWDKPQQEAFSTLKALLTDAPVLAFYDPNAETNILVDASPYGLGAILTQKQQGEFKPIAYGSRALTETESRYSQTEREALAVIWACQHFHYYVYDSSFTVTTDHKPLEVLLSPKSNPPPRIQRWILRLQAYNVTVKYAPGANNPADYLSRNPQVINYIDDNPADQYINHIIQDAVPKSIDLNDIIKYSQQDNIIQQVLNSLKTNNWDKQLKPFYQIRHELSSKDNILLKQHQIVIPKELRPKILQIAHQQHQSIVKTKNMLREKVWWPTINHDVENLIRTCHACQVNTPPSSKCQPLHMTPIPANNWEYLALDLKGPLPTGESIMALIDYRSRYPIASILKSTTTSNIIDKLEACFTMFGYPHEIITDNGPQFISSEFDQYLKQRKIIHRETSTYWPSANGEVERFNRTLVKMIKCAMTENKDWRKELQNFLLAYRTTPHSATNFAPADLFFQHKPNNGIPQHNSLQKKKQNDVTAKDNAYKAKIKAYTDVKRKVQEKHFNKGEKVLVKRPNNYNKTASYYYSQPYTIVENHRYSAKVRNNEGKTFIRNKAHIKKYYESNKKHHEPVKTSTTHNPTNKHDLPSPLVTLVPDPQHDNDEMIISDNESDTSESTIPYMFSESDSEELIVEPVTENNDIYKTKSNRIVTKPKRFRDE